MYNNVLWSHHLLAVKIIFSGNFLCSKEKDLLIYISFVRNSSGWPACFWFPIPTLHVSSPRPPKAPLSMALEVLSTVWVQVSYALQGWNSIREPLCWSIDRSSRWETLLSTAWALATVLSPPREIKFLVSLCSHLIFQLCIATVFKRVEKESIDPLNL